MAYVYKHTRLDKNEVFYIGIGSDSEYKRAYDVSGRNKNWKNIVKKHGFKVDIIYDNINWETACDKEKELIKIIGRKCNKTGTLINITEGGEGFIGNHTLETKTKISNTLSNKTYEEIHGKNAELEKKKRSIGAKKQWSSLTKEEKDKISKKMSENTKGIPKNFKKITCLHCGKEGRSNVMHRWHFNNCKNK